MSENLLPPGQIAFYDFFRPSLPAGEYEVTVEQSIEAIPESQSYFTPLSKKFDVRAPQFALEATEISALFPPDNSNGIYGTSLPYVVLNRRVLPWARALDSASNAPWMVLLLFDASELPVTESSPLGISAPVRVRDFLEAVVPGVRTPDIKVDDVPLDVLETSCRTVTIPKALFRAVTPRIGELPWLAHVRQSDTSNQAEGSAEDGWYSVVLGNRFPTSTPSDGSAGAKNIALLVSLEGLADLLGDSEPTIEQESIALVVLTGWSFVSVAQEGASFAQLLAGLVKNTDTPRIPSDGSIARVPLGYAPLPYRTVMGEETFAWFRGPLSPVVPQPAAALPIYDQAQGVFDLSYAAAWECGRALALADRAFALAMLEARKKITTALDFVRHRIESGFGTIDEGVDALLVSNRAMRSFGEVAAQGLSASLLRAWAREGRESSRQPRKKLDPIDSFHALLADPHVRDWLARFVDGEMDSATEWIARLRLLENVPFVHLIPNPSMLPQESIRFFRLDEGWQNALTDGAMSLGIESSRDVALHDAIAEPLRAAVRRQMGRIRAKRRKRRDLDAGSADGPIGGFVVRSAIVSGWPGFSVNAEVPLLRMQALSPDVMLVLFNGVPSSVSITEPLHGLQFGLVDRGNGELAVQLREELGAPIAGSYVPATGPFSAEFDRGARVVDVTKLANALGTALNKTIGPGVFATELVQAPVRVTFEGANVG